MDATDTVVDAVIIGAGWTGVAVGSALSAHGAKNFLVCEQGPVCGSFWTHGHRELKMHTPWHNLPHDAGIFFLAIWYL